MGLTLINLCFSVLISFIGVLMFAEHLDNGSK